MPKTPKPELRSILASEIHDVHPYVSDLAELFADLNFSNRVAALSEESVAELLYLHPVHVCKGRSGYQLIAGFRTYQLVSSNFDVADKFPVWVHSRRSNDDIRRLALSDLLSSRILHSLGSKPAEQLARIVKTLDEEVNEVAPGLNSDRAIKRAL